MLHIILFPLLTHNSCRYFSSFAHIFRLCVKIAQGYCFYCVLETFVVVVVGVVFVFGVIHGIVAAEDAARPFIAKFICPFLTIRPPQQRKQAEDHTAQVGKVRKKSEGYFYVTKKNRHYYRLREETYQKNESS